MSTATWFAEVVREDAQRRRRYVQRVERLNPWRQLLMVLRSEVSFRVDSIVDANHGQGRSAFSFVRLDWMIQDDPNRPCIGWRLWAYTYWRALHFDLVMRLPRVGWRRA